MTKASQISSHKEIRDLLEYIYEIKKKKFPCHRTRDGGAANKMRLFIYFFLILDEIL